MRMGNCNIYLGKLVGCHPWGYLKLSWTQPWATSLKWKLAPTLEGPPGWTRFFPTWIIVWYFRKLTEQRYILFWSYRTMIRFLLITLFCDLLFSPMFCITECIYKGNACRDVCCFPSYSFMRNNHSSHNKKNCSVVTIAWAQHIVQVCVYGEPLWEGACNFYSGNM